LLLLADDNDSLVLVLVLVLLVLVLVLRVSTDAASSAACASSSSGTNANNGRGMSVHAAHIMVNNQSRSKFHSVMPNAHVNMAPKSMDTTLPMLHADIKHEYNVAIITPHHIKENNQSAHAVMVVWLIPSIILGHVSAPSTSNGIMATWPIAAQRVPIDWPTSHTTRSFSGLRWCTYEALRYGYGIGYGIWSLVYDGYPTK
jgi:hypothetical protein